MKLFNKTAIKSLVVLLCIAICCGGLIAVVNDLYGISDEQRAAKALKVIYDGSNTPLKIDVDSNFNKHENGAEILEVYTVDEEDLYILKIKGAKGYSGNTELFMRVNIKTSKLEKIVISTFGGDDRTGPVSQDFINTHFVGADITSASYTVGSLSGKTPLIGATLLPRTGATNTTYSVASSINAGLDYLRKSGIVEDNTGEIIDDPLREIYQGTHKPVKVDVDSTISKHANGAEVLEIYTVEEENLYIMKIRGAIGYSGSSEIFIRVNLATEKIEKVVVDSFGTDDRTGPVTQSFLDSNFIGADIKTASYTVSLLGKTPLVGTTTLPSTGATNTTYSIASAVNAGLDYLRSGGTIEDPIALMIAALEQLKAGTYTPGIFTLGTVDYYFTSGNANDIAVGMNVGDKVVLMIFTRANANSDYILANAAYYPNALEANFAASLAGKTQDQIAATSTSNTDQSNLKNTISSVFKMINVDPELYYFNNIVAADYDKLIVAAGNPSVLYAGKGSNAADGEFFVLRILVNSPVNSDDIGDVGASNLRFEMYVFVKADGTIFKSGFYTNGDGSTDPDYYYQTTKLSNYNIKITSANIFDTMYGNGNAGLQAGATNTSNGVRLVFKTVANYYWNNLRVGG